MKKFFSYHLENFTKAKESFEFTIFITAGVLLVASQLVSLKDAESERIKKALEWLFFCVFTFIGVFWLPFRRHEKLKQSHETEKKQISIEHSLKISDLNKQIADSKNEHEHHISLLKSEHGEQTQALEAKINKLKTPTLAFEAVPANVPSGRYVMLQVAVLNQSTATSAHDVQIEIVTLGDALDHEVQKMYFHPIFPLALLPTSDKTNSINPGGLLKFNLFEVCMNRGASRQTPDSELVPHQSIVTYFKPRKEQGILGREIERNTTLFMSKANYRIKLAVSAHDIPRLEQEFNLFFSDEGDHCRFYLNPA